MSDTIEEFRSRRFFPFKKVEALSIFYYFAIRLDGKQSKAAQLKAAQLESELGEFEINCSRTIYETYNKYITESKDDDTFLGYKHFTNHGLKSWLDKEGIICEGSRWAKVVEDLIEILPTD